MSPSQDPFQSDARRSRPPTSHRQGRCVHVGADLSSLERGRPAVTRRCSRPKHLAGLLGTCVRRATCVSETSRLSGDCAPSIPPAAPAAPRARHAVSPPSFSPSTRTDTRTRTPASLTARAPPWESRHQDGTGRSGPPAGRTPGPIGLGITRSLLGRKWRELPASPWAALPPPTWYPDQDCAGCPSPPRAQVVPQSATKRRGWSPASKPHQGTHCHSPPHTHTLTWPPSCPSATPGSGHPDVRPCGEGSAPWVSQRGVVIGPQPVPERGPPPPPPAEPNPSLPWGGWA